MLMVLLQHGYVKRRNRNNNNLTSHRITSRYHISVTLTMKGLDLLGPQTWCGAKRGQVFETLGQKKQLWKINLEKCSTFTEWQKKCWEELVWCHSSYHQKKSRWLFMFVPVLSSRSSGALICIRLGPGISRNMSQATSSWSNRKKLKRCTNGSRSFYRSWDISGVAQITA